MWAVDVAKYLLVILFYAQVLFAADRYPVVTLNSIKGEFGQGCVAGLGIFTALHVVQNPPTVWTINGRNGGPVEAIYRDPKMDAAIVLFAQRPDTMPRYPLTKRLPQPGEHFRMISRDLDGTIVIVHMHFLWQRDDKSLVFDGMIVPGMSGSCIVSDDGELSAIARGFTVAADAPIGARGNVFATSVLDFK